VSEETQTTEREQMQVFMENLLIGDAPDEELEQTVTIEGAEEPITIGAIIAGIVAVATWIMQHSQFISDVGEWWARMTNGVTNIKRWQNETDQEVEVWKFDGGFGQRDHYRIPSGQTHNADMWVPWADQPGTGHLRYNDHHAVITVGGEPLAYFWQSGSLVRFNVVDAFVYGGVGVPGAAGAGGNRTMIIAKDPQGRKGFAVGTYRP
jgi:hypothetical protein